MSKLQPSARWMIGAVDNYLLLSIIASLSYPMLFAIMFQSDLKVLSCSFLHATLSAWVMYRIIKAVILDKNKNISMALVFILINMLYFSVSSIKYFEPILYPGFIMDSFTRLYYSLLVLVVLWVSFEVLLKYGKFNLPPIAISNQKNILRLSLIILLIASAYSVYTMYQQGVGLNYSGLIDVHELAIEDTYLSTPEKLRIWLIGLVPVLITVLLAIYHRFKASYYFVAIALLLSLFSSIVSGSRFGFFFFGLGLMVSLIRLQGIGRKWFSLAALSAPLIVCVASVAILSASSRIDPRAMDVIRFQLAYRFDLSDFAATMATQRKSLDFDYQLVADAVIQATPKIFNPNKYDENTNTYDKQLLEAGLNPEIDYTDTFFSIGSQLFGIVGFIVFPVLMIMLLYRIEKILNSFLGAHLANIVVVCMYPLYILAEADPNSLVASWRMLPVYGLFGVLIHKIFLKEQRKSH